MMENSFIDLKLPGNIRQIWNKLVPQGIYISAENERELYNDILRNEDDVRNFLEIFDHKLVVHNKDFIYAEDARNKRLLRGHEQLIVFLAVFFEKYQKIHSSPMAPWYNEIVITTQTLIRMNLYSTESAERRLVSAGLHDEWDIYNRVLKPSAAQFLVQISSSDLYHTDTLEKAGQVEFKFNTPVYRFIDMFSEFADLSLEESLSTEHADETVEVNDE